MASGSSAGDDKLLMNGHFFEIPLNSWHGTSRQNDMALGSGPYRPAYPVNIDEDSYHKETDSQIASSVADERKGHSFIRKQGGCHTYIDRCLQRDQ